MASEHQVDIFVYYLYISYPFKGALGILFQKIRLEIYYLMKRYFGKVVQRMI